MLKPLRFSLCARCWSLLPSDVKVSLLRTRGNAAGIGHKPEYAEILSTALDIIAQKKGTHDADINAR